jgi:hypothetical protein
MSTPEQNIVSEYYDDYKETQNYIFKTEGRKSRKMIFIVAIVLFTGDMLGLAMASAISVQLVLASLLFPVIFLGLGFFAPRHPMMAIIISIIIFAIILILSFLVMGSASIISGLIVKAIIIFCLISGFNSAREAQRARAEIQ